MNAWIIPVGSFRLFALIIHLFFSFKDLDIIIRVFAEPDHKSSSSVTNGYVLIKG